MVRLASTLHACYFFLKNVVHVVKSESSGVVVSCGCVLCLKIKPENLLEMIIAYLNGGEKKSWIIFFDMPIEVGNSLVSLPAFVAYNLLVDILFMPTV